MRLIVRRRERQMRHPRDLARLTAPRVLVVVAVVFVIVVRGSPAHFRQIFDHDEILHLRRNFVDFVQDGVGVAIGDLEELEIEEEVVDDLLDKHRQNAKVRV